MTAPIWMAEPPEVHSALLSSGPGPGPLLASAHAWMSLSTQYTETAEELSALLSAAQPGAWEGPTADAYLAAHVPYLVWLLQASADAAATASQQETAASAYSAALAAMPTLGELAANHATHAALLATNFFGINTIPIAINEADYVRMWVQAATTMSVYQSIATAAVAASPQTTPAPAIVKADATPDPAATPADPFSELSQFLTQLGNVLNGFSSGGQNESLFSYIFNGVPPGANPLTLLAEDISDSSSSVSGYPALLQALVGAAGGNPAFIAVAYMVGIVAITYDLAAQLLQFVVAFPLLSVGLVPIAAIPAALAGLGAGGIVGIAEAAAHLPTGAESIPAAPVAPGVSPAPAAAAGPSAPAPAPAAPAPALAPTATAAPGFPAPSAPGAPPPSGPGPFPYIVGGSSRTDSRTSASASAKRKAPEPDSVATPAAAAAAAREKRKARRRRRTDMLGRDYQYADMDADTGRDPDASSGTLAPPTETSDRGAGTLGFAGTRRQTAVAEAAGLTTLTGDAFAGSPKEPMMPSSWTPGESGEAEEDEAVD